MVFTSLVPSDNFVALYLEEISEDAHNIEDAFTATTSKVTKIGILCTLVFIAPISFVDRALGYIPDPATLSRAPPSF